MIRYLALLTALFGITSADAADNVTVKFKCKSMLHYTCTIDSAGDFSSNCDLIEDFFDKYYEDERLKPAYKAKTPLNLPSSTSYQCSDGTDHFSAVTLTLAPGETKKQIVQPATCQPDKIDEMVSFTVTNGPVDVKVSAASDSRVSPMPALNIKSYGVGTYQVNWTQDMGGAKDCAYPVVFEFSAPAAPKPVPTPVSPLGPASAPVTDPVSILPMTTP